MGFLNNETTIGVITASIPGVLVALVSYYLGLQREARLTRQLNNNARMFLGLEVESNRKALLAFWKEVNALDAENKTGNITDHLAGMARGGLLAYALPHWSFVRWEGFLPQLFAALNKPEIEAVDRFNRDLQAITDLYKQMTTLTPEENAQLERDRFWPQRYAGFRDGTFTRLNEVVTRVLAAPHPLGNG